MEKKQKILVSVLAVAVLIACGMVVYYFNLKKSELSELESGIQNAQVSQENEAAEQLKKLEELRATQGGGMQSSTPEEQLQKLDELRKAEDASEPTDEEVKQQLDQLDALRSK